MSTPENKGTKNPITLKIKFKSNSLEQFIERYSVDVSRGGIFIRTKEPLAVGTPLRFEFQLQDASPLISGDGTVVWNRAFDPNRQNVAPGMGVRFDKLTPESQAVLERILGEKEKRGDTQLESRFDAGVRAMAAAAEPPPSQETPKNNMFGDEPTRAMAADQVNKLAEAMQRGAIEEDQPTRHGVVTPDLADEVRKLAGNGGDGSGSLPAIPTSGLPAGMPKMEPMKSPGATPMVRSTLIGQGFGLAPRVEPSNPGLAGGVGGGLVNPALRPEPSSPALAAGKIDAPVSQPLDSQVTPVKSEEVAARVADSQRTPTNPSETPASQPSGPTGALLSGEKTPIPGSVQSLASGPNSAKPEPVAPELTPGRPEPAPVESVPAESTKPTDEAKPSSGSSFGLLVGAALLLLLVAAAGYFVFVAQKPTPPENKPTPTEQLPPQPPQPPPQPPVLIPEKAAIDKAATPGGKEPDKTTDAAAAAGDGVELVTDPPGAQVELAGKPVGVSPTRLPGLTAGKLYEIKVTLRGYQEIKQKIKLTDDKKPIQLKLAPIERQIEIISVPKGADVYIDGKKAGRTPWIVRKLDLSKPMNVEIRRAGFETWTHTVSDAEAFTLRNKKEVLTLNATLEQAAGKKGKAAKKPEEPAAPAEQPAAPAKPAEEPAKPAEPAKTEEPAKPKTEEAPKPAAEAPEAAKPAAP